MGTYAILKALRCYWSNPAYPMHRTEPGPLLPMPTPLFRLFVSKRWRPVAMFVTALVVLFAADILCAGTRNNPFLLAASGAWTVCGTVVIVLIGLALLILSYVWPVVVAVRASRAIAIERERRTWDMLLTLPYDRAELLLGKLAATLRDLNVYSDMFLWVQSFLALLLFLLVVGVWTQSMEITDPADVILAFLLLAVAVAEFVAVRFQDYVLAGLIGAAASLVTPTRQTAGTLAMGSGIAMILLRAFCTAIPLFSLPVTLTNGVLILATGPTSAIAMIAPVPLMILLLLAIPLTRELLIRLVFGWLVNHLSDVPATAA